MNEEFTIRDLAHAYLDALANAEYDRSTDFNQSAQRLLKECEKVNELLAQYGICGAESLDPRDYEL